MCVCSVCMCVCVCVCVWTFMVKLCYLCLEKRLVYFKGWIEKSYEEVEKKFWLDFSWRSYGKFFDFVDICNWWKYNGSIYENYVHEIYIIE